jgi:phenylalanyl-tRNA synthetase beta chain
MKISHNWLQNYFDKPIPDANKLAELFTLHSFEIESVEEVKYESLAASRSRESVSPEAAKRRKEETANDRSGASPITDFVIDAKVLPDRAHYCLSHKGIAGEVSVLTGQSIKDLNIPDMSVAEKVGPFPSVTIQNPKFCRRYMGRYVAIDREGPTFSESSEWMKNLLEAIGERSISGIVDATNFCMFDIGQPLHAFDADKIKGNIVVRSAKSREKIILLDGTEIVLASDDYIIADDIGPLAIAGVKGGKRAEVRPSTRRLFIESANFDPISVRRTSTKYNLRSESSKRYENEITPELTSVGMNNACALIKEMNPDVDFGPIIDEYPIKAKQTIIDFDPVCIKERLGIEVPFDRARKILEQMEIIVNSLAVSRSRESVSPEDAKRRKGETANDRSDTVNELWQLTIPFNRLDLMIREDIVEEIGRIYGYEHIQGILPSKTNESAIMLPMHYLAEKIRNNLVEQGFSEVSLYTLVEKGDIETAKPLAKDKAFARKNLTDGMMTCLKKNALNADLLDLQTIKVFEIGKVFSKESERLTLSLGVAQVKKAKGFNASTMIKEALQTISLELNIGPITATGLESGLKAVCEIDLEEVLKSVIIPAAVSYKDLNYMPASPNHYEKISLYPFIVRDIAVFVPESVQTDSVWQVIEKGIENAGTKELLMRHSLFDTFKKDGKISYAFRLVFQSMERTLTDNEANAVMEKIYDVMKEKGWEVR